MDAQEDEVRAVPDGDFKTIHLGEDLSRSIKIGANLTFEVRSTLIECLRGNTDFFPITPHEMLDIDPSIVCKHVNVHTMALYISLHQRRQSPEKDEVITMKPITFRN